MMNVQFNPAQSCYARTNCGKQQLGFGRLGDTEEDKAWKRNPENCRKWAEALGAAYQSLEAEKREKSGGDNIATKNTDLQQLQDNLIKGITGAIQSAFKNFNAAKD